MTVLRHKILSSPNSGLLVVGGYVCLLAMPNTGAKYQIMVLKQKNCYI